MVVGTASLEQAAASWVWGQQVALQDVGLETRSVTKEVFPQREGQGPQWAVLPGYQQELESAF